MDWKPSYKIQMLKCVCFSVSGYVLNLQYDMPLNLSRLCPSPVCIFPMGITLWKQRMTNGVSTPTKMTNGNTLNKHRCGKAMGQTHGFRKMIYKWWLEKSFPHVNSHRRAYVVINSNLTHIFNWYMNRITSTYPYLWTILPTCTGWWLQPLWKIWKSAGVTIPNIWKVIKFIFQTTNRSTSI